MSDVIDQFWKQYCTELSEHLEIIETSLVEAEAHGSSLALIAELFRSFHSIKGLSRSMDLFGIEKLSHISEDILGVIREGKAEPTPDLASLMLETVDALKKLIDHAVRTG